MAMSHSLDDELEGELELLELELEDDDDCGLFFWLTFLSFWNSFNNFFWVSTGMLRRERLWVILFFSCFSRRACSFFLFFCSRRCCWSRLLFSLEAWLLLLELSDESDESELLLSELLESEDDEDDELLELELE